MGSKYGGGGGGWRFFSGSVYGVALNQTYTELIQVFSDKIFLERGNQAISVQFEFYLIKLHFFF